MIKIFLLVLVVLLMGVYLGIQLPRGPALLAMLGNMGASENVDYQSLKSHQALLNFEGMIANTRQLVLSDAQLENFGDDIAGTDNLYMLGSYQLNDNEALLVKVSPPNRAIGIWHWNHAGMN